MAKVYTFSAIYFFLTLVLNNISIAQLSDHQFRNFDFHPKYLSKEIFFPTVSNKWCVGCLRQRPNYPITDINNDENSREPLALVNNLIYDLKTQCSEILLEVCLLTAASEQISLIQNNWKRDFSLIFLIWAQVEAGNIESATKTLNLIAHNELKGPAALSILSYHINQKDIQSAKQLASMIVVKPNSLPYLQAWTHALSVPPLVKLKMFKKGDQAITAALNLIPEIADKNTKAEIYALIALGQLSIGKPQNARKSIISGVTYANETHDPFLKALAFIHLGYSLSSVGEQENANELYRSAMALGYALNPKPRALVMAFLASKYAAIQNEVSTKKTLRNAIESVNHMTDPETLGPVLAFIAQTIAKLPTSWPTYKALE